jgi:hypothetical protein
MNPLLEQITTFKELFYNNKIQIFNEKEIKRLFKYIKKLKIILQSKNNSNMVNKLLSKYYLYKINKLLLKNNLQHYKFG